MMNDTRRKTSLSMMVIASGNARKHCEIKQILQDLPITLMSPMELLKQPVIVRESGTTFEENAILKALAYAEAAGISALADDSGIEIDALGGGPGVYSARFAGPGATDAENNRKLIALLRGVAPDKRTARYQCVIAVANPGRMLFTVKGTCEGRIQDAPEGSGGFGYDPYFFYPPLGATFAQLAPEEKHRVSHRGAALRAFRAKMETLLS